MAEPKREDLSEELPLEKAANRYLGNAVHLFLSVLAVVIYLPGKPK